MKGRNKIITGIYIAGSGKVGRCLAISAREAGLPLQAIISRDPLRLKGTPGLDGIKIISSEGVRPFAGLLLILTVPDNLISSYSMQMTEEAAGYTSWEGVTVVHCSGALPASVLAPFKVKGASVASFHPIQTITDTSSPEAFHNITISLQGDKAAVAQLRPIVELFGAWPLEVDEIEKLRLHIAAVFVSNYLAGLMEAAQILIGDENPVEKILGPLHNTAAQNLVNLGSAGALTGPVERGDTATIVRHLGLLDDQPDLKKLYAHLGLYTLKVARRTTDRPGYSKIEAIFNEIHTY
jgi:predicted short-subunit dehydrogenase-like oxidoreductase (DUF2520 family)